MEAFVIRERLLVPTDGLLLMAKPHFFWSRVLPKGTVNLCSMGFSNGQRRLQVGMEGICPVYKKVELNRLRREAGDKEVRGPIKRRLW